MRATETSTSIITSPSLGLALTLHPETMEPMVILQLGSEGQEDQPGLLLGDNDDVMRFVNRLLQTSVMLAAAKDALRLTPSEDWNTAMDTMAVAVEDLADPMDPTTPGAPE